MWSLCWERINIHSFLKYEWEKILKFSQIWFKVLLHLLQIQSTSVVDPRHLKAIEYDISLTKKILHSYQHSKNQLIHIFILDIQQIFGSHELKDHGYFDHAHSEIIHSTFSSPEFAPPFKRFIPSVHSWDRIDFRVPWPDWPHNTQKFFNQLLILVNLHQHAKKQFIPYVHSSIFHHATLKF